MPFIDDSGKDLSGNVKDQRRYVNDGKLVILDIFLELFSVV